MGHRGHDAEGEGAACEVGGLRKEDGDEMHGPPSLIRGDTASMRYVKRCELERRGLGYRLLKKFDRPNAALGQAKSFLFIILCLA